MSLEAINEQLLRAVGVGIALFGDDGGKITFQNDVFGTWFEEATPGATLAEVLPQIDMAAMQAALDSRGRYSTELSMRKKRRTLVLALIFTRAQVGDQPILVLECQNITRIRELESMLESYSTMVERNTREIQREKERVEKLLLNVMPKAAYEEYKSFGTIAPQRFDTVAVLMLDFVGFASTMDALPPATFVSELNEIYGSFDRIGQQFGCERIKTTGETYMCIAGMHENPDNPEGAVANTAARFIRYLRRRNENAVTPWMCRIGLGAGPVVGSVIGTEKYVYDVFGAAVNAAAEARAAADALEVLAAPALVQTLSDTDATEPSLDGAREKGLQALAVV